MTRHTDTDTDTAVGGSPVTNDPRSLQQKLLLET